MKMGIITNRVSSSCLTDLLRPDVCGSSEGQVAKMFKGTNCWGHALILGFVVWGFSSKVL